MSSQVVPELHRAHSGIYNASTAPSAVNLPVARPSAAMTFRNGQPRAIPREDPLLSKSYSGFKDLSWVENIVRIQGILDRTMHVKNDRIQFLAKSILL